MVSDEMKRGDESMSRDGGRHTARPEVTVVHCQQREVDVH